SPQLNPIEFAFGKIKKFVQKEYPISRVCLIKSIINACNQITPIIARKFCYHSTKFFIPAFNREDLF
ncbi:MAG: hypothetical protein AABX99_00630, partial [Nanoarchaeota archaeon]